MAEVRAKRPGKSLATTVGGARGDVLLKTAAQREQLGLVIDQDGLELSLEQIEE